MHDEPAIPKDLDPAARKKWIELTESGEELELEVLGNYCRMFSNLQAIRRRKKSLQKAGKFPITGADGKVNPLLVAEGRILQALSKTAITLGLVASRERVGIRRASGHAPPGMYGKEPVWGFEIEAKLCGKD